MLLQLLATPGQVPLRTARVARLIFVNRSCLYRVNARIFVREFAVGARYSPVFGCIPEAIRSATNSRKARGSTVSRSPTS